MTQLLQDENCMIRARLCMHAQQVCSAGLKRSIIGLHTKFRGGGKLPRSQYLPAASNMQTLANCMALITHATRKIYLATSDSSAESGPTSPESERSMSGAVPQRWIVQLARVTESSNFDAHMVASILCQLSGALYKNSALSPISTPASFPLVKKLRQMKSQAIHTENI